MASPYQLSNVDLQFLGTDTQDFSCYIAFLNPILIHTNWNDLNMDAQGNWQPPPNEDLVATHRQPYAPTANLGGNRIGFVDEPLYFDSSRSCQRFDLPVVTTSWTASGGGVMTFYDGGKQLAVTWPSPGLYAVSLTVTNTAGTTTTGTRQIMIYQDRASALPGLITLSGLSGSLQSGGWQCQVTTVNSQVTLFPPDSLPLGTYQPIVVLVETRFEVQPGYWVDRTLGVSGHFNPGCPYQDPRILFDGYIQSGTIHQDIDKDTLSFSCTGPQMILQESKTHMLGYYSTVYSGYDSHGNPTGLKTTSVGQGWLVCNLRVVDVIHSLLQSHCTIGIYHDIHIWQAGIPTQPYNPGGRNATYDMIYTTLSVNEGTIWQNITDLTSNEWGQIYCERDGSIRVGPQINYRGSDYWQTPTLLGETEAETFINLAMDLGYTIPPDLTQMAGALPTLPAQPMPITFVHPWGHQMQLPVNSIPFQSAPDPTVTYTQAQLNGPPIHCVLSDIPIYDASGTPPSQGIFPWITANWPQDLAVYPYSFDISERYTGRTTLVKLVGTLYGHTSLWTSWYPQDAFSVTSDGSSTIVTKILPAGNWVVNDSHVLPDVTSGTNKQLVLNWWWEMARREYYAQNLYYSATVNLGIFTGVGLGDIVAITRQNNTLGPHWLNKPFYVTDIAYNLDLASHTWSTTLTLGEVTSRLMGPIVPPPQHIPKS